MLAGSERGTAPNLGGVIAIGLSDGEDLEIITWTIYPAHGNLNEGPLGFRLGDGIAMSFMGDFARAINGRHGLMELQPGQVNWGAVNPQPYPGAVGLSMPLVARPIAERLEPKVETE